MSPASKAQSEEVHYWTVMVHYPAWEQRSVATEEAETSPQLLPRLAREGAVVVARASDVLWIIPQGWNLSTCKATLSLGINGA